MRGSDWPVGEQPPQRPPYTTIVSSTLLSFRSHSYPNLLKDTSTELECGVFLWPCYPLNLYGWTVDDFWLLVRRLP